MSGKTVSHYRIVEKLGQGGMGEVFLADDLSLGRKVALKFLPDVFTDDPERLARFEREAKILASLNHPNIAAIHSLEAAEGRRFLVLELVEGETLAQRLAKGALPIDEALEVCRQIAEGVEAAHEKGIIHRDLKPSNVKIAPDGRVKVLDFGLAKAFHDQPATTDSPTISEMTHPGVLLGTAAYMSPEQAKGKTTDKRTDIWSFGCILYECLTGRRPFQGETVTETLASIIRGEPDWDSLPAETPSVVRSLVMRCLHKERRWQHIGDVRLALEDVKTDLEQPSQQRSKPVARWPLPALTAVALVALAVAGYFAWQNVRLSPAGPSYLFEQATDEPGQEMNPSLSADGRSVVYASSAAGNWDIYLLRVGGKNPINLTKDSASDDTQPVFSPDGGQIAFRSERDGGGIFIMGATGESVRRLTDSCYLPAWSPNGKEIACSTVSPYRPDVREASSSQIFVIDVESGKRRLVSGGVLDAVQPSWSPDRRRIAFWGVREGARDIFAVSREGGDATSITEDEALDWDPVWSPDGKYLYFSSDRGGAMNLWRVAVSATSGRRIGDPEPVNVPSTYATSISFSRDGRRLAYSSCQRSSNLYWIEFDHGRESVTRESHAVTKGIKETLYPSISRDGAWIAFTLQGLHEDLAVVRPDGSEMRRITEDAARDREPRWSPDGGEIAFMSTRSGRFEIWTIRPDGSALRQVTEESPRGGVFYPAWSPDGRRLSYNLPDEMGYIVETRKAWREQQPELARVDLPGQSWLWVNDWSHDGTKIAGTLQKLDGGTLGIGAYNLKTEKLEQYTSFGRLPRWLPDGRRLLFHANGQIFLADSTGKRTKEILSAKEGTINPYFDVSWDGRMIAFSLESVESNIWIMTAER
jgi:Tol biopolymer transport system component